MGMEGGRRVSEVLVLSGRMPDDFSNNSVCSRIDLIPCQIRKWHRFELIKVANFRELAMNLLRQ
jgi:hypothetical protein